MRSLLVALFSVIFSFTLMAKDTLNILTIGNSFTWSLDLYFRQVVESAGCKVNLDFANWGGCELFRHWQYITLEEGDYRLSLYQEPRRKLREILGGTKWDIVTIQQASHQSWDETTYQPYATNIRDYVKLHAPQAELVIQQTWSYRADENRIRPGGSWGFDQDGMYERLTKCYRKTAEELGGIRIIPTGYAVQLARAASPVKFVPYERGALKNYSWPDLPPQAGDVVGQLKWTKTQEGELVISADCIHLNSYGQYLQACVWFASLFERPTSDITFVPDNMSNAEAQKLREIAQLAVDGFMASQP